MDKLICLTFIFNLLNIISCIMSFSSDPKSQQQTNSEADQEGAYLSLDPNTSRCPRQTQKAGCSNNQSRFFPWQKLFMVSALIFIIAITIAYFLIIVLHNQKAFARPINPLRRNHEGKTIDEVLYKAELTRKKRDSFIDQRFSFVSSQSRLPSIFLAKYNMMDSEQRMKQGFEENQKEWQRLENKFNLSNIKEELPMCIIVPSYNNNANFRIQSNLNSIFTQNYTNYKVIVINDVSNDGSNEVYRNYFSFYAIDKQRYTYIENSRRATALQNIYFASINHCSKNSIILNIDGDDQLIGRNVLQVFNWAYQTKRAGVVYSNFYYFQQPQTLKHGFTSEYTEKQKKENLYRVSPMKFSHLRSYRAQLIHHIDPKDLQDQKGAFFTIAADMALMFPLLELSCSRVGKIQGEFHYLYNVETGLNDYQQNNRQLDIDSRVRRQRRYECLRQFDERMNQQKPTPVPQMQSQNILEKLSVNNPNVVIDVAYASKDYGSLPINSLIKTTQGKKIEDVLYKDESIRKKRIEFLKQRSTFINYKYKDASILFAKYNIINNQQQLEKGIEENQREWSRLQSKFQLSHLKEELPMCIVVPSYNNNVKFRIEANLNSIFTQNYTNYKVIVINDASTDGSEHIYRSYFSFHAIDNSRNIYIENSMRKGALHNIYFASLNNCSKESIVVTVDGDDQLIGRNVLQVLNWAYQTQKAGVVYSNFYIYQQPHIIRQGQEYEYSQTEKKENLYRNTRIKFVHLHSYRNELIFQIDPEDLKDQKGSFFTITYDLALFVPLMQLSCGRVHKIKGEFHYLFNVGTGLNDYLDRDRQLAIENRVRGMRKYECFKQFDQRIQK